MTHFSPRIFLSLAKLRAARYTFRMIADKIPVIQRFSAADKLSLVTELWEELEGMGSDLPVAEDQKRLLDERFARHGEDPNPGSSWSEVKGRLLKKIEE